jgi:hypothetical protein
MPKPGNWPANLLVMRFVTAKLKAATHLLRNRIRRMGASRIARIEMTAVMIGMSNYLPIMYSPAFSTNYEDGGYCSFAYSVLGSFRMRMSGSASHRGL